MELWQEGKNFSMNLQVFFGDNALHINFPCCPNDTFRLFLRKAMFRKYFGNAVGIDGECAHSCIISNIKRDSKQNVSQITTFAVVRKNPTFRKITAWRMVSKSLTYRSLSKGKLVFVMKFNGLSEDFLQ